MAEKPSDPKQLTLGLDEEKTTAKPRANTSSYKVVLKDDGDSTVNPAANRKKPSVTTRSMTVTIPSQKKPGAVGTKPKSQTVPAPRKSAGVRTVRTVEQPSPHLVQTHKVKPKSTPAPRPNIEPPKLGKRKGYKRSIPVMVLVPLLIAALLFCFAVLWWVLSNQQESEVLPSSDVEDRPAIALTIERGMTARSVSLLLEQLGVVEDSQALLAYFVENNLATILKTGLYLMNKAMSYEDIGRILTSEPQKVQLTIPSAFTLKSADAYLVNRLELEPGAFLQAAHDLATAYNLGFTEGWLLSGIYTVNRERSAPDLVVAMYQAMLGEIQKNLESPLLEQYSIEELLIIASMIQAETQDINQMQGISSVIHNRLKNNEPLGIDATTRYELNDWVNPIPTNALETKSPYNTRRKVGLPPTGICSPGPEAVHAAFFPSDTQYLYYLHDADRQIHYAFTYEEHKENIKRYR